MLQRVLLYHILPGILLIYVGLGVLLFVKQTDYIFRPTNTEEFVQCTALIDAERVDYRDTRAYFKNTGSDTVVVLYHGNAGTACDRAWYNQLLFAPHNLSYLIVEYQGYARDNKKPSGKTLYDNAAAMVDFLDINKFAHTIVIGESIGTAPAAHHAYLDPSVDAVILTTPFTTLTSVASHHYPLYPMSVILRHKIGTTKWLKEYQGAVHIFHGTADRTIPISESEQLYDQLGTKNKTFTKVMSANHNSIYGSEKWFGDIDILLSRFETKPEEPKSESEQEAL